MEDVAMAVQLLKQITEISTGVTQHIQTLIKKVKNGDLCTAKGISLLEVKYQLLLSYLTNLSYTLLKKTSGQSIQNDPTINRLVEIRTVLEKIRPIDQKLKYQIDKLIKTATTGRAGTADPLRFKPNPNNLISKLDDGGSESDSDEEGGTKGDKSKPKIYVPPKLAAVHYDGEETTGERQERMTEKAKRKALSTSMLKELRQEYQEGPQEIRETRDLHRVRDDKRTKERTDYEEDHFVRLSVTRKEKHAMKRMATLSSLDGLARFDDISALDDGDTQSDTMGPSSKKRKLGSKKGKKSLKGGKRGKKRKY